MSVAPSSTAAQQEGSSARLRHLMIGLLFALGSVVPRLVHLRRSPSSWLAFRVLLGFAGAGLVVVPLGLWNSWLAAIVGMAMFLAAVLLPPAKPVSAAEEKAHELGALMTVDGGKYQTGNARPSRVQLFVGKESIFVLDLRSQPLLVIPVGEINSTRTAELDGGWNLQIRWKDGVAEFSYSGIFAERLARAAESSVASVMRSPGEVLRRTRAASA